MIKDQVEIPAIFLPEIMNRRFHPFHHDDELVTVLIHEVDVFLAEVSSTPLPSVISSHCRADSGL